MKKIIFLCLILFGFVYAQPDKSSVTKAQADTSNARLSLLLNQLNNTLSVLLTNDSIRVHGNLTTTVEGGGDASAVKQDSIKQRIINQAVYFNSIISELVTLNATDISSSALQDSIKNRIISLIGYIDGIEGTLTSISGSVSTATNQSTQITRLDTLLARTTLLLTELSGKLESGESINVGNFPSTQAVTQSGAWNVSVSNDSIKTYSTDDSTYIKNFPATQAVTQSGSWSVAIGDTESVAIKGNVSIGNFPATQTISGTVTVGNDSIKVWSTDDSTYVKNFPATQAVTGTFWQATQPVSGTVTVGNDSIKVHGNLTATVEGGSDASAANQTTQIEKADTANNRISQIITELSKKPNDNNVTISNDSIKIYSTDDSVYVKNFPATQAVTGTFWQSTQPVSVDSVPNISNLLTELAKKPNDNVVSGTVTVTFPDSQKIYYGTPPAISVNNFPSTQNVLMTNDSIKVYSTDDSVYVKNFPASQTVAGTISVDNFPATQTVDGTVNAAQSGSWSVAIGDTESVAIKGNVNVNSHNVTNAGTFAVQAEQSGSWSVAIGDTESVAIKGNVAVTGDFYQATQPISASSLPLPTGASTSANQSTVITRLDSIDAVSDRVKSNLEAIQSGQATATNQSTMVTRLDSIDAVNDRQKTDLEAVRNKLDSVLVYKEANKFYVVNDTTSNGNDTVSLSANFSKYVWITITADDSIQFSFSSSYAANTVFNLKEDESYTTPVPIDIETYPTLYYRRWVVSGAAGVPNVRITLIGK